MAVFEVFSVTEDDVLTVHESTELTTGVVSHIVSTGSEVVSEADASVVEALRGGASVL